MRMTRGETHSNNDVASVAGEDGLREKIARHGQIVLVLQGGGALGAYEAGVYEALHDAGIEPDWVIGNSIGAIHAGIIAGNKPADRLEKMKTFWNRVTTDPVTIMPWLGRGLPQMMTMMNGITNFCKPN